jgi:deoxyribonuclease-4
MWERSVAALAKERERCEALGIPFLIVHPGSHTGAGEAIGIERIARAVDRILLGSEAGVEILLEITAGQGTNLGGRFEELASVVERARTGERIGICFDTCHALASGYEFRDAASYEETMASFDRTLGIERLRAFHLNDSRAALGSRIDRHAHIGHGKVGLEAFRLILNDPRFEDVGMVIETEKGEDLAEDRVNLAVLRSLRAR